MAQNSSDNFSVSSLDSSYTSISKSVSFSRTANMRAKIPVKQGFTAESMRAGNLALVLHNVLNGYGEASRASVASETGITRATVSRIVEELLAARVLEECPPLEGVRGRPAVRLQPKKGQYVALGLDANVNYLAARVVDLAGNILASKVIQGSWAGKSVTQTMTELGSIGKEVLAESLKNYPVENQVYLGCATAIPALIWAGKISFAPNLNWRNVPITQVTEPIEELSIEPKLVANDGDLAAFAYSRPFPGVPSGPGSFVYLSGAVGIGAGIMMDHRPLTGAHGLSGEIGHICINPDGPKCACGSTGCLEAYLGIWSLLRNAGYSRSTDPKVILDAVVQKKPQALQAMEAGGVALGRALAAVINTIDIPLVVLGGSVSRFGKYIKSYAMQELKLRTVQSGWTLPEIRFDEYTESLAVTGAAYSVLQLLADDPFQWTKPTR